MQINSINSINFKGCVESNFRNYIRKQTGILIDAEIASMTNGLDYKITRNIDRINTRADIIIDKFEKKAKEMHKDSYIGIKSSNAKKTGCRIYSGNERLFPYAKSLLPISSYKGKTPLEKEYGLRSFEIAKQTELSKEEAAIALERLEELADNFDPKETDKKFLENARTGILSNLQEIMDEGNKINTYVQKEFKKEARAYDKVKKEVEGKSKTKKTPLLKQVLSIIKHHNKQTFNVN